MKKKAKEVKLKKDAFFKKMDRQGLALSYDDTRMKTGYSNIDPLGANVISQFSRNVPLINPIIGSPMDTVTEAPMCIELAKLGCLGIIHRALNPKEQSQELARAKFYLNGLIKKPIKVKRSETVEQVLNRRKEKGWSFYSFPVINNRGEFVGIVTENDFVFCMDHSQKISKIMSPKKDLFIAKKTTGIRQAFEIMQKHKKKLLPLIDKGELKGMYIFSDVRRIITGSQKEYNLDSNKNLRVGAAVGVGDDALERLDLLAAKGVDVVVIDTAHADTDSVMNTLKEIKRTNKYSHIDIVVGNISEPSSAKKLVDAGADGIKVGQGPGSICTTRIIAGIGHPQVSAVYKCSKVIRGSGVPIIADGGIKYSGDIAIAIGVGADSVMLGSMLAGTKESPGRIIDIGEASYKVYRGMGSIGAMEKSKASRERYRQSKDSKREKLVPEGIEGVVPYKGSVSKIIFQCVGGLRAGMGYVGASNITELQKKADFHRNTSAGLAESHPHTVTNIQEAPNYKI